MWASRETGQRFESGAPEPRSNRTRPTEPPIGLLRLQRAAGNRAVGRMIAAVQRISDDLEVRGKYPEAAASSRSLFFRRNDATVDEAEATKLRKEGSRQLPRLELRGYASEDEDAREALVGQRLDAVEWALRSLPDSIGTVNAKMAVPDGGAGHIDYRKLRRVDILLPEAQAKTKAAVTGGPSQGEDVDCGDGIGDDCELAEMLLKWAIEALTPPLKGTTKNVLAHVGGVDAATGISAALQKILAHFTYVKRKIPINDPRAGGHRCVGYSMGDAIANNVGIGADARLTLYPNYFKLADDDRALALIHEASHGTADLVTVDLAYRWQRLLAVIPPERALRNADSLVRVVELVNESGKPSGAAADRFVSMSDSQRRAAAEAMAWLEQWLTQGSNFVGALYETLQQTIANRAWPSDSGYYQKTVMPSVAKHFGLTVPPTLPSREDAIAVAGIFDRLSVLSKLVRIQHTIRLGEENAWALDSRTMVLTPELVARDIGARLESLLKLSLAAVPKTVVPDRHEAAYAGLLADLSDQFGGP